MAFPASTQVKVDGFQELRTTANELKRTMQTKKDQMASQTVSASFILSILKQLKRAVIVFDEVAAIDGIVEYVQAQYDDNTLNVVAEFSAMKTASDNTIAWIVTNLPKDSNNYLLLREIDVQGNITDRTFTSAITAGLRTQLDTLIATIG